MSLNSDNLIVLRELGRGAIGAVYLVKDKDRNVTFAAKIIPKKLYSEKEITTWKMITGHVNVVSYIETISAHEDVCILMEPVDGMDLFEYIDTMELLKCDIADLFRQLLVAIDYIHKKGICHLDIKPENIMVEIQEDIVNVKLIDYDSCEVGIMVKSTKGTLHFIPPERLSNKLAEFDGQKADIWACGIVLYEMMTKFHPFLHEDETFPSDMFTRIKTCNYVDPRAYLSFEEIDPNFEDLIGKIFILQPELRPSAEELLRHPFFG